jgi:hypothetical protein
MANPNLRGICIRHPVLSTDGGESVPQKFVAFGIVEKGLEIPGGSAALTAVLDDGKDPHPTVVPGVSVTRLSTSAGWWAFMFQNVPVGVYRLLVQGPNIEKARSVLVEVLARMGGITVGWPSNGLALCNAFIAYGTTDLGYDIATGDMDPQWAGAGGPSYGTVIAQPSLNNGSWAIQFSGVPNTPSGGTYNLNVTDTNGNSAGAVTGLTVATGNCRHH